MFQSPSTKFSAVCDKFFYENELFTIFSEAQFFKNGRLAGLKANTLRERVNLT